MTRYYQTAYYQQGDYRALMLHSHDKPRPSRALVRRVQCPRCGRIAYGSPSGVPLMLSAVCHFHGAYPFQVPLWQVDPSMQLPAGDSQG